MDGDQHPGRPGSYSASTIDGVTERRAAVRSERVVLGVRRHPPGVVLVDARRDDANEAAQHVTLEATILSSVIGTGSDRQILF